MNPDLRFLFLPALSSPVSQESQQMRQMIHRAALKGSQDYLCPLFLSWDDSSKCIISFLPSHWGRWAECLPMKGQGQGKAG